MDITRLFFNQKESSKVYFGPDEVLSLLNGSGKNIYPLFNEYNFIWTMILVTKIYGLKQCFNRMGPKLCLSNLSHKKFY